MLVSGTQILLKSQKRIYYSYSTFFMIIYNNMNAVRPGHTGYHLLVHQQLRKKMFIVCLTRMNIFHYKLINEKTN